MLEYENKKLCFLNEIVLFIEDKIIPYIVESVDDEIWQHIKRHGVIAGGCLRDFVFYSIEDIKDIDIFFPHCFNLIEQKLNNNPLLKTSNSITITVNESDNSYLPSSPNIQLISKFSGSSVRKILEKFDINICQIGYSINSGRLLVSEEVINTTLQSVLLVEINYDLFENIQTKDVAFSQAVSTIARLMNLASKRPKDKIKINPESICYLLSIIVDHDSKLCQTIKESMVWY